MISESRLNRLIGSAYDAALDPVGWEEVVTQISDALGGAGALLYGQKLQEGDIDFAVLSRLDPKEFDSYGEYYFQHDVWAKNSIGLPTGTVTGSKTLVQEDQFLKSEFYQDFLAKNDIFHLLASVLCPQGDSSVVLSIYRPRRRPDFGDDELRMLQMLTPHLQRAMRILRHIGLLRQQREFGAQMLDRLRFGVLLVDQRLRVAFMNRAAERLIGEDDGISTRGGNLVGWTSRETSRLRSLVSEATRGTGSSSALRGGNVALPRPSLKRPLQVLVAPLTEDAGMPVGPEQKVAMLLVADPEREPKPPSLILRELYGFTLAEARFVAAFVAEPSIRSISERLAITEASARVYMKRVFARTGVHSQAELMKLILTGPATLRDL